MHRNFFIIFVRSGLPCTEGFAPSLEPLLRLARIILNWCRLGKAYNTKMSKWGKSSPHFSTTLRSTCIELLYLALWVTAWPHLRRWSPPRRDWPWVEWRPSWKPQSTSSHKSFADLSSFAFLPGWITHGGRVDVILQPVPVQKNNIQTYISYFL